MELRAVKITGWYWATSADCGAQNTCQIQYATEILWRTAHYIKACTQLIAKLLFYIYYSTYIWNNYWCDYFHDSKEYLTKCNSVFQVTTSITLHCVYNVQEINFLQETITCICIQFSEESSNMELFLEKNHVISHWSRFLGYTGISWFLHCTRVGEPLASRSVEHLSIPSFRVLYCNDHCLLYSSKRYDKNR